MKETNIVRLGMLQAAKLGATMFRNNTAQGWAGKAAVRREVDGSMTVTIRNAQPLHAGLCVGSSDLIGWTDKGQFVALEAKTDSGRLTKEQEAFIRCVNASGGIAGEFRNDEDIVKILQNKTS